MFNWRSALALGAVFIVVGTIYFLVQGADRYQDLTGALLLVVLGCAMALSFTVLLRGSREL